MARNRASASGCGGHLAAANARATSVAAPSPTIRPIASSPSGSAPNSSSSAFADCAEIAKRVDERPIQIKRNEVCLDYSPNSANEVGVSHTLTRTTASPWLVA